MIRAIYSDESADVRVGTLRRGAILVLAAFLMVVAFAFTAFAIDIGYIALVRGELQNCADAAALAGIRELPYGQKKVREAAKAVAKKNPVANKVHKIKSKDIELGFYDLSNRSFTPSKKSPNAVRVTARVENENLFFAPVIGHNDFDTTVTAIAMLNPRDLVFVVDLSGSMNDDTEPGWVNPIIENLYGPLGYSGIPDTLMTDVYTDLRFGDYPGELEHIGKPLGVPEDKYAYANMTRDDGPLAQGTIPVRYRINNDDSEWVRKQKAYAWIIDYQLKTLMPEGRPVPSADDPASFAYWSAYLDYVIRGISVGQNPPPPPKDDDDDGGSGGGGGGGTSPPPTPPRPKPPAQGRIDLPNDLHLFAEATISSNERLIAGSGSVWQLALMPETLAADPGLPRNGSTLKVRLPPSQDGDRIDRFNNPNRYTYGTSNRSHVRSHRNHLGYLTYVQFMMDFGRDRSPDRGNWENAKPGNGTRVQLSVESPHCRYHWENTAGGSFKFPPREMPTHAVRRSLIAALDLIQTQNTKIKGGFGDHVAIVTYDALDAYHAPQLVQPLTGNYSDAMQNCTRLQAASDIGATTATDAGLILARAHLKSPTEGGQGREFSEKVIVMLSDGVPNVWQTPNSEIDKYIGDNSSSDFYGDGYYWYNSALMQSHQFYSEDDGKVYPIAMGLGADLDFADRLARLSKTDQGGQSPRAAGNPIEYEQRLITVLEDVLKAPGVRLVE